MRSVLVLFATGLYRALVTLRYRGAVRERFATAMVRDFRTWLVEAMRRDGLRAGFRVGVRAVRDLLRPLPPPIAEPGQPGRPRSMRGWVTGSLEDVGFAARSLRREPRFVAMLVGVMAVGVALNVTAFTLVDAYLLRPLPYPGGERLVAVNTWGALSWSEGSEVFDLGVSWDLDVFILVGDGRPELTRGAWITPDFLEAYDVQAAVGRRFTADEAGPGGSSVAMISHRLWRDRFGGDPNVAGRTFRAFMSDRPDEAELFTIVGVLPDDFWYVNDYTDVLVPIREERAMYTARLRPGVDVEQARAHVAGLVEGRIVDAPPGFRVRVESLRDQYVTAVRPTLVVLQIAVLLVLLIACANAAVLLLVRTTRREQELSIRRALGAGRTRIVRQLVAEGLIVASFAGVLGAAAAAALLASVREVLVDRLGRSAPGGIEALGVDGSVLLATAALSVAIGVLFGLVPVVVSSDRGLSQRLRGGARTGDSAARRRARSAMVACEVAVSLALLSAAGSMVRSAVHLQTRDIGFDPAGLTLGSVGLRAASYPAPADRTAFFERLSTEVRRAPGVSGAAVAGGVPFNGEREGEPFEPEGGPGPVDAVPTVIGDGYFGTMGIPVLRGRDFVVEDADGTEPVAIVSESAARALWPGQDPIGRRLRRVARSWVASPSDPGPFHRVVGMVGDVQRGVAAAPEGDVYLTYRQGSPLWMILVVRSHMGQEALAADVVEVLRGLDPEVPLSDVLDAETTVEDAQAPTRFLATVLGGFSAFAFLLAIVGLYGVIAYAAREQRREIAIRVALGADRGRVVALFAASGLAITGAGVALGSGGSVLLGSALEGQLHGVSPYDPATLGPLVAAFLVTALAAIWVPALAAARSDPMEVLREE